jgi:hypothetical protein
MAKNAAVEKSVKCFKHFVSQKAVLVLKQFFPVVFEFFSVMVNDSVKRRVFWATLIVIA